MGYPPIEKGIFTHHWFDVGRSSEESIIKLTDDDDDDSPVTEQSILKGMARPSRIE